ncbi:MAG: tetratricopeptide repeat protein, partial [Planctomycetales bacterium]
MIPGRNRGPRLPHGISSETLLKYFLAIQAAKQPSRPRTSRPILLVTLRKECDSCEPPPRRRSLACCCCTASPSKATPEKKTPAANPKPPLLVLDAPEPFIPKTPRAVSELEQLEAQALFLTGRFLEQRRQRIPALKTYQRALRHDPDSLPILKQIVQLSREMGRSAEAMRYAVKAVELDPSDLELVRWVGSSLIQQRDLTRALEVFERTMKSG